MKVKNEIIQIIANGIIDGNTFFLPQEQLDRATYEAVNKCLSNLGGKWNRKAKGHVFDYDPDEAVSSLILTGETENTKKLYQYFPTPRHLAEQLCDMAELTVFSHTLEPECGGGDLADVIYERGSKVFGVELNKDMDKYLNGKPYPTVTGVDFLKFANEVKEGKIRNDCDRVVMNPPFAKQQDIDHVYAAWSILKKGILVSIMSPSPFFRTDRKSTEFREFLKEVNAEIIDVPEGEFKESGTMIRTKIIKIKKGVS